MAKGFIESREVAGREWNSHVIQINDQLFMASIVPTTNSFDKHYTKPAHSYDEALVELNSLWQQLENEHR